MLTPNVVFFIAYPAYLDLSAPLSRTPKAFEVVVRGEEKYHEYHR
jgi:hypothetical protein